MVEAARLEKGKAPSQIEIKMSPKMEELGEKKLLAQRINDLTMGLARADVVVPLLRSGPLVYQLAESYIETAYSAKGSDLTLASLPPQIDLLAGEEIYALFEDETGIRLQDYKGRAKMQERLPFDPRENKELREAFAWLERQAAREDSPIRQILLDLGKKARGLGPVEKVVVVDDMVFQGPTKMIVAPYFLGKVFPGAELETHALIGRLLTLETVGASFPSLFNQNSNLDTPQEKARRAFLEELMKGYTDYKGWLVKITEDNWEEIGQRVASNCRAEINPAKELVEQFNYKVEDLLGIQQLTIEALRTYGINLFYQTHLGLRWP